MVEIALADFNGTPNTYYLEELIGVQLQKQEPLLVKGAIHQWLDSHEISDNLELVMTSLLDPDRLCIQKHIRGQITFTPDGNMLLGKLSQQGLENLWISAGLSSGISQGPGAGMALAEMMTYGSSDIAVNWGV